MVSIRHAILIPFIIFVMAIFGGFSLWVYLEHEREDRQQIEHLAGKLERSLGLAIQDEAALLETALSIMRSRRDIIEAYGQRDRTRLLSLSARIFDELNRDHGVTHFYFTDAKRVNFLRVHQPGRFGDVIDRHTTRLAMETGRVASGVELGPLGTFTLRVVMPLHKAGELIGFLELGKEIDDVLSAVRELYDVEVFVFVPKHRLDFNDWQAGMVMLGRHPSWGLLDDFVLVNREASELPADLVSLLQTGGFGRRIVDHHADIGGGKFGVVGTPFLDAAGREIGYLVFLQDLTQPHIMAQKMYAASIGLGAGSAFLVILIFWIVISRIEKRLQDAETREMQFGQLLTASLDEIYIVDANSLHFVEVNSGGLEKLGYQMAEMKELTLLDAMPMYDSEKAAGFIELLCSGKSRSVIFDAEMRRRDGSTYPVEIHAQFAGPDKSQLLLVARDTAERLQREAELIAARDLAERASRAKSEFLSNMSHELRTPLNSIMGFSQLYESDENLSEQHREDAALIHKAGRHLLTLVNQILDLAKIEAGELEVAIEPVSLQGLMEDCYHYTTVLAGKHNIHVDFCNGHNYIVNADPIRLKQVLLNFLSNAVKYNYENGSIRLYCEERGSNRLRISVTDTGRGMTQAQIDRLFQPFERVGQAGAGIDGAGIGLMISKELVEKMGGVVGVSSAPGEGSTFWLELALAEQLPADKRPGDGRIEVGLQSDIVRH